MCTARDARHSPELLPEPDALAPEERAAALRAGSEYFERVLPSAEELQAAFKAANRADPFTG
jgi:hypothetical protein